MCLTADSGGSNGYKGRLWKVELQILANELNKKIRVVHFPPGTSKWNKVEHRLFCYISANCEGKPLVDVQTAVDLISFTRTTTWLEVICVRDDTEYKLAGKVSDEKFEIISIAKIPPFEAWNYKITST